MTETRKERNRRLVEEGRFEDFKRRRDELRAQRPADCPPKMWNVDVLRRLLDEFGPDSLRRLRADGDVNLAMAWREVLAGVGDDRRATQRDNFEWAMSYLGDWPEEVELAIPSRSAVKLLIEAIESPDGRKEFLEKYCRATADRRRRRVAEPDAAEWPDQLKHWLELVAKQAAKDFLAMVGGVVRAEGDEAALRSFFDQWWQEHEITGPADAGKAARRRSKRRRKPR